MPYAEQGRKLESIPTTRLADQQKANNTVNWTMVAKLSESRIRWIEISILNMACVNRDKETE